jgi:hypothetical protein
MFDAIIAGIALGLAILALLLLSGCTAPVPGYTWNKTAATQADFASDSFGCKQTARATVPGGGVAVGGLAFVLIATAVRAENTHNGQQQVYNECMAALGYTPTPAVAP